MAPDPIDDTLADLERTLTDLEATLMDHGRAGEALSMAREADDFDGDTVSELMDYLSEQDVDDDLFADVQGAAEMAAEERDTDMAELSIDALAEHLSEGDGDDDSEDDDEDEPVTMDDLEAMRDSIGQVTDMLGDIGELLQAKEDQHAEQMETLERRLSEIEETPVIDRTLTGETPSDGEAFYPEDGDGGGGERGEHEDLYL